MLELPEQRAGLTQCSLSVRAGSTMMIVMEYMGNGVLDSFLRVSAVGAGGNCGALPRAWALLAVPP